jgi:UDPglucose 6-dehydrogenase
MEHVLRSGDRKVHFEILSNPEFLAEGTAIKDLEQPDRVLIGGHDTPTGRAAVQALVDVYAHWIPRDRILTSSVWSSELSKLAANAFLAQRISSINSLSVLCERTEADVVEVSRAIGMDRRIGPYFLNASVGFGGSCFRKDILNLVYLCEHYGLKEVADYWAQVIRINEYQEDRFVRKMVHALFGTLAGKRIAVFGFAFKADTGDTRDSPAIRVCRKLVEERAQVVVTDPQALKNARKDLADIADSITFEADPYKAAEGAHALAFLTDWKVYETLDYPRIFKGMEKPAFIFDGRNRLNHAELFTLGFDVYPIGRRHMIHP